MVDFNTEELCLIDSGINALSDLPLNTQLKVLNLHCNHIGKITNLSHLHQLCHLDLSSNKIKHIEGLDNLVLLRTLNLSSNFIQLVKGLTNLRSLVKINLAYNQIIDISGFKSCHGSQHKLSHVNLHGNKLQSIDHVIESIRGCVNIRQLTFETDDQDNPLCHLSGYFEKMIAGVPRLEILDGRDRSGQLVDLTEVLADIPGLEQYMDYLTSSLSSQDVNPISLATPAIDHAMERFRQRGGATTTDLSTTNTSDAPSPIKGTQREKVTVISQDEKAAVKDKGRNSRRLSMDHELRLEKLEHQICRLLYQKTSSPSQEIESENAPQAASRLSDEHILAPGPPRKYTAKRDVDQTDESDIDGKGQSYPKSRSNLRKKTRVPMKKERSRKDEFMKGKEGEISSQSHDEKLKKELQDTYVQLMQELELERERRWKAEQAARKLAEHLQKIETKAREEHELQDITLRATTRLKQAVTNERDAKIRLQNDLDASLDKVKGLEMRLKLYEEQSVDQKRTVRAMEDTATKVEADRLRQKAFEAKRLQECQMHEAAVTRECELLKNSVRTLKSQLQQIQELLAAREQEHRKTLEGKHDIGSPEIQQLINQEKQKIEENFRREGQLWQHRFQEQKKAYKELEDEFRLGLTMEAHRFNELQAAYENVSKENAENRQALSVSQNKDKQSSQLITELTSLVREQKGRISELSRSKQEQTSDMKERVITLESHLEEARKKMVQMELLRQEKLKLQSQVQGQDSIIEGLRSERKLWGHELAQQGASLAQDRGRLEAKIEALNSEVSSLKKELLRDEDALKIKSKMLEDQTETMKHLKAGLEERDTDLRKTREECLNIQNDLERQLSVETALNQDMQEKVDQLTLRKEALKQHLADLQLELEDSKKAHNILNKRWKDKSEMIGKLEQQVQQVKETWDAKERKLTVERDEAMAAKEETVEKLHMADNTFRQQLNQKETVHKQEIQRLLVEKEQQIDIANRKVLVVEEEMRQLLKENENNKHLMEQRMKKMTQMFNELQHDLRI